MRGKPPYYLEADALITCIERATYYSRATKYPLIVYCDQAALQWIKTASKGAVTAWRIERLNGLNYEVKYKPGKINVVADALSRYPMIGPRQLGRRPGRWGVDTAKRHTPAELHEALRGETPGDLALRNERHAAAGGCVAAVARPPLNAHRSLQRSLVPRAQLLPVRQCCSLESSRRRDRDESAPDELGRRGVHVGNVAPEEDLPLRVALGQG